MTMFSITEKIDEFLVLHNEAQDSFEAFERYWRARHEIEDYVRGLESQLSRQLQPHSYGDCPACGETASFLLDHQTMEARCTKCQHTAELD